MGKVVGKVLRVGAVIAGVALAIPTGGTSLLASTLGISGLAAAGLAGGLGLAASLLTSINIKVPQSETHVGRLHARLDPRAPRKLVMGPKTAMRADVRFEE